MEETINPGLEGRILSFEAVLELDQELGPQDNFTLQVEIFDDGYRKSAKTDGGNITANETAKAEMDRFGSTLSVRMEHIQQISPMMCFSNYWLNPVSQRAR